MATRHYLDGRWILVVDDDSTICEIVQMLLESRGFDTRCAENGQEALSRMADTKPALVLTDLMMPIMSGRELLSAMRSDERLASVPVVVMTAWNVEGNALGADGVLIKPIGVETLVAEVERWTRSSGREQVGAALDEVALRPA